MNLNLQSLKQSLERQYQMEKLHPTEQFKPFLEWLDDCWYYINKAKETNLPFERVNQQLNTILQFFFFG